MSIQWCIVLTAQMASTEWVSTGSASAAPAVTVIWLRLRWNRRRTPRMPRMNGVGSTATTSAPRRAACTVLAPIPAPISTTRSPGWGFTSLITASLISDRHIRGAKRMYRNMAASPWSLAWACPCPPCSPPWWALCSWSCTVPSWSPSSWWVSISLTPTTVLVQVHLKSRALCLREGGRRYMRVARDHVRLVSPRRLDHPIGEQLGLRCVACAEPRQPRAGCSFAAEFAVKLIEDRSEVVG